ncbi:MAG: hypothetical protein IKE42_13910 [Aquamicrobium sp.]|uniref:hypothetical protein n=1 Tax=Mesorhizobium sp. Pch-S TaxID=2082387 RepID=UPI0010120FF4|nr:hypothetical protein [Mesorhizobium sp. Pch-S]MBR2688942.1 hypothetical protein [Aquamicrobium sp.]
MWKPRQAREGLHFNTADHVPGRNIAVTVLALVCSSLLCGPARAHDAPVGWSYDVECCSGLDCYQAPASDVKETRDGYLLSTGELIPYSDRRIRPSRDEFFHECKPGGQTASPRSLCLYVPNRGL